MGYGVLAVSGGSALSPTLGTAQSIAALTTLTIPLNVTGVQRLTIGFHNVKTTSDNSAIIRLGSSAGIVAAGYLVKGIAWRLQVSINRQFSSDTSGFPLVHQPVLNPGGFLHSGLATIYRVDPTNFIYNFSGQFIDSLHLVTQGLMMETNGAITLPSEITQFQVSTIAGVAAFSGGTVGFFTE